MSVLVITQNEQEEKVLLAFLDSLRYKYQPNIEDKADQINADFLEQYTKEIDQADTEIESGNYVRHEEVEQLFQKRRKVL